jgi:hypothetical protein
VRCEGGAVREPRAREVKAAQAVAPGGIEKVALPQRALQCPQREPGKGRNACTATTKTSHTGAGLS